MSSSTSTQTPDLTQTPLLTTQDYHILMIEDLQGKRFIPLSYATYSLGRDQSNTIQLQDSAISRQHLILLRVPLKNRQYLYRVVDGDANGKASLNGISVNGVPCSQKDLAPEDTICLGEVSRITYLVQSMTEQDYHEYFNRQDIQYRSIQTEAIDPIDTMTTILAR